ncbi:MAG: glycosyltransferase [Egibacteraceae bacterium]
MNRRVVSFAWGRGLGHVSRLIAVHRALGDLGWGSLFLVERQQRMIADYEFAQVMIPTDKDSLIAEPLKGVEGMGNPALARLIVDAVLSADDVVLHDVIVHRDLYEQGTRLGCRQMLTHRFHKNRPEPAIWVARHTPSIRQVFVLGKPEYEEAREGVALKGVHDVMRQPLAQESIWSEDMPRPRIVVTAAGGGHDDAKTFLTTALEGIRLFSLQSHKPLSVYVITGPNFHGTFAIPPGMKGSVRVTPYVGPRYSIYRDTTALVTHGGYNTVQELASTGMPAVVVVGVRTFDDQRVHLNAAADRLNAIIIEPTPENIADGLTKVIHHGTEGPRCATPPKGAWEIAHTITQTCMS